MSDYISREAICLTDFEIAMCNGDYKELCKMILDKIANAPAADVRPVPEGGIGEMSDGYHTFNGLYYQRMVLFAALVKAHKDKAWKSWRHEDGKPCFDGGWFIVGIDTPQGSYTYHYEGKYWNWFECEELPVAKHWDGHTEEDVTRLLSLDMPRWIPVSERLPEEYVNVLCHLRSLDRKSEYYSIDHLMEDGQWWKAANSWKYEVTHWMPLPEPPKCI